MTRRQMQLFYRKALKAKQRDRADRAEEVAAAFAGGDGFTKWVDKLRNTD
ncbi:hypothetical protein [Acidihalobacter prosperus]|uniref:Uncharacterized protein n=1 Tax=Acidihalobacter prosperus TaxID=160660 RepID=A0A1A6C8B1_9GAMM|nr:hypothetical protein [Acidihalobacter prosperus]OBS10784.1 hypothetical protein Thpro_020500 [Acidihalobacter prosperus]